MKKLLFLFLIVIGIFWSNSSIIAGPRDGAFLMFMAGVSSYTDSEMDPANGFGTMAGYHFSKALAVAGSFHNFEPDVEASTIMVTVTGANILWFPSDDLGGYLGFHFGMYDFKVDPSDVDIGDYSYSDTAIGLRFGWEANISGNLFAGIDLSYFATGATSTQTTFSGKTVYIEVDSNGLTSALGYLKYYF